MPRPPTATPPLPQVHGGVVPVIEHGKQLELFETSGMASSVEPGEFLPRDHRAKQTHTLTLTVGSTRLLRVHGVLTLVQDVLIGHVYSILTLI